MRRFLIAALVLAFPLVRCGVADDEEITAGDLDVNSRYTIESVSISGQRGVALSDPLRSELDKFVGARLDHPALEKLAGRIKNELRVPEVAVKVGRGTAPEHVVVNFEVAKSHEHRFDVDLARFLYHSGEGATAEGGATTRIRGNAFTLALLTDSDQLLERFAGLRARFERKRLGTDRLHLTFEFDSFHEQWNPATVAAAAPMEIYRSRQVFTPEATLVIAAPLELSFGTSFARFRPTPLDASGAAAKTESSNAVVTTLRYHRRWGSEQDSRQQEMLGEYSLRAATRTLGTDALFSRHLAQVRYRFRRRRNTIDAAFMAGRITGNAPLYERFVLGNSTTLRGWNKYELDPLGASHVVHGSVDFGYRRLQVFYDTGAVWDLPQQREQKQSIGAGFKVEAFQLAVAFPLRGGRPDPVFYAGLNF